MAWASMKKAGMLLMGLVFLVAFGLRVYDLSYPGSRWMDESGHVPAASQYWTSGQTEPDNWEHPPLRHILLYGFLQVFGDNPYGWRLRNVLFGSVAALLAALLVRAIGDDRAALMAGLLLATDPLHIVLSRYTFEEIYGGAFFLASVVAYLRHDRRSSWLAASAVLMGCALATKWYYVPAWLMLVAVALHENRNWRDARSAAFIGSVYLFIPAGIYLLSYYPWFGRGYTTGEFVDFIRNAYASLQRNQPGDYYPGMFFLKHLSAGEWFIRPIAVGQGTYLGPDRGEFIIYMNSLPVWILTLPSMVAMAVWAARSRSMTMAMPMLCFSSIYLLYVFVRRPAFLYSSAPLLPFAFAAIAFAVSRLAGRFGAWLFYAILVLLVAWNLYLYPLVTAKKVPVSLYRPVLEHAELNIIE